MVESIKQGVLYLEFRSWFISRGLGISNPAIMDAARISLLLGLLLAIQGVIGFPAACSKTITARSGDTCASISITAGINVADFLRNNPSITQCDKLSIGSQYCIDSGASQSEVSLDGQCGGNLTCIGSPYGQCCSAHGWYVEPLSEGRSWCLGCRRLTMFQVWKHG